MRNADAVKGQSGAGYSDFPCMSAGSAMDAVASGVRVRAVPRRSRALLVATNCSAPMESGSVADRIADAPIPHAGAMARVCHRTPLPPCLQFGEVPQAILLESEPGDARVRAVERPLAEVLVLEDSGASGACRIGSGQCVSVGSSRWRLLPHTRRNFVPATASAASSGPSSSYGSRRQMSTGSPPGKVMSWLTLIGKSFASYNGFRECASQPSH
jgi:hypothetical protein